MPSPWKVNFIHSSPWLWHALLVPSLSHCHCICSWSYRLFSSLILCCFLLLNPLLSLLFFSTLAQFTCHFNYAWSSWFSVPFTREKNIPTLKLSNSLSYPYQHLGLLLLGEKSLSHAYWGLSTSWDPVSPDPAMIPDRPWWFPKFSPVPITASSTLPWKPPTEPHFL